MADQFTVIVRAQELLMYVLEATAKSPKEFRFIFTNRMQNWATDVLEAIILANDVYIDNKNVNLRRYEIRRTHQHAALTKVKMLAFMAHEASQRQVITFKQYERIATLTTDVQYLVGGWIKSDKLQYRINW